MATLVISIANMSLQRNFSIIRWISCCFHQIDRVPYVIILKCLFGLCSYNYSIMPEHNFPFGEDVVKRIGDSTVSNFSMHRVDIDYLCIPNFAHLPSRCIEIWSRWDKWSKQKLRTRYIQHLLHLLAWGPPFFSVNPPSHVIRVWNTYT